jgi:predicted ATPase
MELVYLWINRDGKTIRKKGFNFSAHIRVNEKIGADNYHFELTVDNNHIPDFFNKIYQNDRAGNHADIINVTGIIGENGSGKTNLLKLIAETISSDNVGYSDQVMILKDTDNRKIHIYNSLDQKITVGGNVPGYTIQPVVEKINYQFSKGRDRQTLLENKVAKTSRCIYYSPVFDLNEYPLMIDNSSKSYIDVSTNGLISEDTYYNDIYVKETDDRIRVFRRANTLRQLELTNFYLLKDTANTIIPPRIKVEFERVDFYPEDGKRNLTVNNEEIFLFINKLIDSGFSAAHAELHKFEGEKRTQRNVKAYNKAKSEKIKVEFIYSFLHNFFKNLSSEYHAEIGLTLKDFEQTKTLFGAATLLFTKQKWNGFNGLVATEKLFEKMISIIDRLYNSKFAIHSDDTYVTTGVDEAKEVMNFYYNYLDSLPTEFKSSFMSVTWRNISSGEQSLLDLYSRLSYALSYKVMDKEEQLAKRFQYIYLLIDEGESGFHPQWQKSYLYNLLQFIYHRFADYRVQIIASSHSPFIVSDLPENNLIFLKNVDGHTEIEKIGDATFAANIHGLFAHQFFINDGVKGAFAQHALTTYLQAFINDPKMNSSTTIGKFIELIGEPVLKEKLEEIQKERASGNV